jgi:tetratricopeptide (TPR) repeat protein
MVKDEEEVIVRCVNSAARVADQVLVFDTGSSDRTHELVDAQAVDVVNIEFAGNYSDARNTALEQIDSEWILAVDADEHFDNEIDSREIRDAIASAGPDVGAFAFVRYSFYATGGFFSGRKTRLFRNDPTIRYRGSIHEDISPSVLDAGYTIVRINGIMNHCGPMKPYKFRVEKNERYLKQISEELSVNPRAFRLLATAALISRLLGRLGDADRFSKAALEYGPSSPFAIGARGLVLLAQGFNKEARECFVEASATGEPEQWLNMAAIVDISDGRIESAEEILRSLISTSSPWIHLRLNLGLVLALQGLADEATIEFQQVIDRDAVFLEFDSKGRAEFDPYRHWGYETLWNYSGLNDALASLTNGSS